MYQSQKNRLKNPKINEFGKLHSEPKSCVEQGPTRASDEIDINTSWNQRLQPESGDAFQENG